MFSAADERFPRDHPKEPRQVRRRRRAGQPGWRASTTSIYWAQAPARRRVRLAGPANRAGTGSAGQALHVAQAPEVVLHLPGRSVGVPGSQLAQQPAARAQDHAVGRRPDRHEEVLQPPSGRAHQPGQVAVTGHVAQDGEQFGVSGGLALPVVSGGQAGRPLDTGVQRVQVLRVICLQAMRVAADSSEIIASSVIAPSSRVPGAMSSRRAANSATG
jgi:hypothetical protein